jgi:hypothetical protein
MTLVSFDQAIVGFVDILGFRNLVRAPGDRHEIAGRLDNAIQRALESFGGMESLKGSPDAEWRVRVFSDCICVAKPLSELGAVVTMEALCTFSQEMLERGFPIRGGVAIGPHIESEVLIFSETQIQAYDIETSVAVYPRVVLSKQLSEYLDSMEDVEMRLAAKEYIVRDADENSFVNYLVFHEEDSWLGGAHFYEVMKAQILQSLSLHAHTEVLRAKYIWAAQFHNWSLQHTARRLKLSGTLSEDDVWDFGSLVVPGEIGERLFLSLISTDPAFQRPDEKTTHQGVNWLRHWPDVGTEDDEAEPDGEAEPDREDGDFVQPDTS